MLMVLISVCALPLFISILFLFLFWFSHHSSSWAFNPLSPLLLSTDLWMGVREAGQELAEDLSWQVTGDQYTMYSRYEKIVQFSWVIFTTHLCLINPSCAIWYSTCSQYCKERWTVYTHYNSSLRYSRKETSRYEFVNFFIVCWYQIEPLAGKLGNITSQRPTQNRCFDVFSCKISITWQFQRNIFVPHHCNPT